MIRVRDGDEESILTIDEFERRARSGELSPFAFVCIPALTDDQFVQARELPLFVAIFDPRLALFRRHFHLGRLPLLTGLLALACIALYFVASHKGGGVVTRDALLALGAKTRARIVDDGEAWRLLAANVLHRDLMHLAFNLFALLNIGTVLEGVYRRGDYVLLLVVAALSTMGLSAVTSISVTVGASGLVFGCLGAAVVFGMRFSDVLPLRYRLYFGVVVVGYAAVMFYLGLQRPTTDNWGHAGGLVAGLVMGALLEPRLLRSRGPREPTRDVVKPWIIAAALAGGTVASGPALSWLLFRFEPYPFDTFGVVLDRPADWAKGPDPLGFLAFSNGVDALTSLACGRRDEPSHVDEAVQHFIEGELRTLSRGGHIGDLQIAAPRDGMLGSAPLRVPARIVPFSFVGSDGPFVAEAHLFSRGELECAFVLAHRTEASPRAVALLEEIRARLRLVPTRAQRRAEELAAARPFTVKAQLERALAHQSAGDVAAARGAFDAALHGIAEDPGLEPRVHFARARFELDFGQDLAVAQREAAAAWASTPDDPEAALLVVDVLMARKDEAGARAALATALVRHPEEARLLARDALLRGTSKAHPKGTPG